MKTKSVLESADVKAIAAAAEAEALKNNWAVSICIVDDGGHMLSFQRLDGAAPVSAHIAPGKAVTAAMGRRESKGYEDMINGGRVSFLSAPGLEAMLEGGRAMDHHFRHAPFADNLPVLLALVGLWHASVLGYGQHCVLAYDDRLRRFPAFLQQLEMESNGKSTRLDGSPVTRPTCPVLFGEPGTNAQHSFMQLVHQGTAIVPVDFILAARPDHDDAQAHRILAANALAQAAALLQGKSLDAVTAEMRQARVPEPDIARLAPHRVFHGDRPSITILFERLDAFTVGRLIALYEHKVAVQGFLWGINSFDQWGVELGKLLAKGILPSLTQSAAGQHDPSTAALIARFRELRGE